MRKPRKMETVAGETQEMTMYHTATANVTSHPATKIAPSPHSNILRVDSLRTRPSESPYSTP